MAIPLKDAVKKMRDNPRAKYYYFFCEKAENNKPLMLADTRKIAPKDVKDLLAKAKAKGNSHGSMRVADGILTLTPDGPGLTKNKLQTGAMVAAGNAQVFDLISSVVVGREEPEPEAADAEAPDEARELVQTMAQIQDTLAQGRGGAKQSEMEPQVLEQTIAQLQGMLAKERDVLKQKAMSALLEKKEADLAKLTGRPEPRRIDRSIDPDQQQLLEHGFAPKAQGAEYADEEKNFGWRAKPSKPPEQFKGESQEAFAKRQKAYEELLVKVEKLRVSEVEVTKHYTPEEREAAKVQVDAQGRLIDSSGKVMTSTKSGYVMDTEGQMHQFREGARQLTGKMVDDPLQGGLTPQVANEHHTSPLAGADVAGAGGVQTNKKGLIKRITNQSGHYKPGAAQMIQTVETLLKKGALLDKEWTDANGDPLTGPPLQLYDGVMTLQAKITEELADDPAADVSQHLEAIDKAKKMLTKLGCGPSNKISPAIVAFFEVKEGMTGMDVVTGSTKKRTVDEFLRSGAGYKNKAPKELIQKLAALQKQLDEASAAGDTVQQETLTKAITLLKEHIAKVSIKQEDAKSDMLEALKEKTAKRKEQLDEQALQGVGTGGPSKADLEDMADELDAQLQSKLEFTEAVEAFEKKYGSLADLADDTDRFEDILIAECGLIPMILKRFSLPAQKLAKWMKADRTFRFFELDEKLELDEDLFETLFKGYYKR